MCWRYAAPGDDQGRRRPDPAQVRPLAEPSDRAHQLGNKTIVAAVEAVPAVLHACASGVVQAARQDLTRGRLCRARFQRDAAGTMWRQFDTGMMAEYLANLAERQVKIPDRGSPRTPQVKFRRFGNHSCPQGVEATCGEEPAPIGGQAAGVLGDRGGLPGCQAESSGSPRTMKMYWRSLEATMRTCLFAGPRSWRPTNRWRSTLCCMLWLTSRRPAKCALRRWRSFNRPVRSRCRKTSTPRWTCSSGRVPIRPSPS